MKKTKYKFWKISILFILLISNGFVITAQEKLKIGTKASVFEAVDNYNKNINLTNLVEKGPVVLLFYRGEWCKYCNLYMHDLSDSLTMITDLGATVIAVTPESDEYIRETVNKTNASFSIIYDEGHKIMDEYKVTWHLSKLKHFFYKLKGINLDKSHRDSFKALPVPATYIIGTDGNIKGGYFNPNFTKRMPVTDIIDVINTIDN